MVTILKSLWQQSLSVLSGASCSPGLEVVQNTGLVEVGEVAHVLAPLELGRVHLPPEARVGCNWLFH